MQIYILIPTSSIQCDRVCSVRKNNAIVPVLYVRRMGDCSTSQWLHPPKSRPSNFRPPYKRPVTATTRVTAMMCSNAININHHLEGRCELPLKLWFGQAVNYTRSDQLTQIEYCHYYSAFNLHNWYFCYSASCVSSFSLIFSQIIDLVLPGLSFG
jgi:hypothetical protein